MKAQRRHDLQENELAKVIKKAPTFWQESGGKFLALSILALVIVIIVKYKISANREGVAQASNTLGTAREIIAQVQQLALVSPMAPPSETANRRRQFYSDANNLITDAMKLSDDRAIQAEALVAKGDLNWSMASLPAVAGASTQSSTQSSLQFKDPRDLRDGAVEAYKTVVNNFADQKYAAIAARFGLAAIAEDQRDWEAAKAQYDKLALETKDWPAYQNMAATRLTLLKTLREPVTLAAPATLPAASTLPAMPDLLKPPTTVSATAPVAPATVAAEPAKPQAAVAATAPASAPSTQPQ